MGQNKPGSHSYDFSHGSPYGGIGIMNIMLASVLKQTRAIAIRRAVGARRRDIRFQFLLTAFALSLLGGLAGIALGLAIADVVAPWADWPTVVTPWSIALSTGCR